MKRFEHICCFATDNIALTDYCNGKQITYSQISEMMDILLSKMCEAGIKKGDRIGIVNDNSIEWIVNLMSTITYGACAIVFPANSQISDLTNQANIKMMIDEINGIDIDEDNEHDWVSAVTGNTLSGNDEVIINYKTNNFGQTIAQTITVQDIAVATETVSEKYAGMRLTRNLTILTDGNNNATNLSDLLASLSLGASITMVSKSDEDTILKCIKKNRPHLINIESAIAEQLIRKDILPLFSTPMISSHTRRAFMKQVKKQMMYGLGGCVLCLNVFGSKFSPDIEHLLQKIQFPYQIFA